MGGGVGRMRGKGPMCDKTSLYFHHRLSVRLIPVVGEALKAWTNKLPNSPHNTSANNQNTHKV